MKRILLLLLTLCTLCCISCNAKGSAEAQSGAKDGGADTVAPLDAPTEPASSDNAVTDTAQTADKTESADTGIDPDTQPADQSSALPLAGKKICVDAGHGTFTNGYYEAVAPGAAQTKPAFVSGTAGSYQSEAEFNLKVAQKLRDALVAKGAEVYMTREDENATLSNIGRAEFANELGCDLAVRIHADGSENSSARGISMLVPGSGGYITDTALIETSSAIGKTVLDAVIELTGAPERGVVPRNDMTGFNWSKIPSILIECGFMSNPEEDLLLNDPAYQQLIADGIVEGLIRYYTEN